RGAWGANVLDLTDAQITEARRQLDEAGVRVAAIGSPIGKVPIDSDFDQHLERFNQAVRLAREFEAPFIRIFSFYPPTGPAPDADPAAWRGEMLRRLTEMTVRARAAGLTLVHEHVKDARQDGTVTVAGEGLSNWPALLTRLRADGYDGVLSLEPHLAEAGRFS